MIAEGRRSVDPPVITQLGLACHQDGLRKGLYIGFMAGTLFSALFVVLITVLGA